MRHFGSRVFGLIFVPLMVYIIAFQFHFKVLGRSGPGDANMSSLFQAGLGGSDLSKSPVELAYGSLVTLKSNTYGGGLLHSHVQTYPVGSKQQQVTTYHHKDHNNMWKIVHPLDDKMASRDYDVDPIEPIRDGDVIRLVHNSTGHLLHSHRVAAPVNGKDYEVSGYGRLDHMDPNDLWRVEIVKESRVGGQPILRALSTKFRLKHVETGCYLKSRNNALPEWGFRQGEVSCDYTPELKAKYLQWNVETHINERLPEGDPSQYKSNFWDDFRDCNVGMYITNNALIPDVELEPGALVSQAREWFFMQRGIRMCSWADDRIKFYMLGNPAVWWTGSAAVIVTGLLLLAYTLIGQRKATHLLPDNYENFKFRVKMVTGAWALTYLPFFVMGRVLYVHHYYPALIFSTLNVGLIVDHFLGTRSARVRRMTVTVMLVVVLGVFLYFSPMCYGIEGPGKAFSGRRWLSSWAL